LRPAPVDAAQASTAAARRNFRHPPDILPQSRSPEKLSRLIVARGGGYAAIQVQAGDQPVVSATLERASF